MLFYIIDLLKDWIGIHPRSVFMYTTTRMVLAALTSMLLAIFLAPRFIEWLAKIKMGQSPKEDRTQFLEELHKNKQFVPSMGGIYILFSILISFILYMDLSSIFSIILLFVTVSLGLIGWIDDYLKLKKKGGISARVKFSLQSLVAAVVAIYLLSPAVAEFVHAYAGFIPPVAKINPGEGERVLTLHEWSSIVYFPFIKQAVLSFSGWWIVIPFFGIMFVVTGTSNAVNLTDGLDGLASGCLILVSSTLALFAFVSNHVEIARYLNILYIEGAGEIAIFLCAVTGACLGFLWYNGYPAQVFMGDTGSLSLGGIIGVSAVLLKRELLLGIIGGVFVAEALSVIIQVLSFRYRNKQRVFLCAPLHHHFQYKGWPEAKVVLRFWIVGLILAMIGLASLRFQ
jgi:phospho-N-acetylmuramoyl-pentapeptide-transferase